MPTSSSVLVLTMSGIVLNRPFEGDFHDTDSQTCDSIRLPVYDFWRIFITKARHPHAIFQGIDTLGPRSILVLGPYRDRF